VVVVAAGFEHPDSEEAAHAVDDRQVQPFHEKSDAEHEVNRGRESNWRVGRALLWSRLSRVAMALVDTANRGVR
jgi:hypothetical protein